MLSSEMTGHFSIYMHGPANTLGVVVVYHRHLSFETQKSPYQNFRSFEFDVACTAKNQSNF